MKEKTHLHVPAHKYRYKCRIKMFVNISATVPNTAYAFAGYIDCHLRNNDYISDL